MILHRLDEWLDMHETPYYYDSLYHFSLNAHSHIL